MQHSHLTRHSTRIIHTILVTRVEPQGYLTLQYIQSLYHSTSFQFFRKTCHVWLLVLVWSIHSLILFEFLSMFCHGVWLFLAHCCTLLGALSVLWLSKSLIAWWVSSGGPALGESVKAFVHHKLQVQRVQHSVIPVIAPASFVRPSRSPKVEKEFTQRN